MTEEEKLRSMLETNQGIKVYNCETVKLIGIIFDKHLQAHIKENYNLDIDGDLVFCTSEAKEFFNDLEFYCTQNHLKLVTY